MKSLCGEIPFHGDFGCGFNFICGVMSKVSSERYSD